MTSGKIFLLRTCSTQGGWLRRPIAKSSTPERCFSTGFVSSQRALSEDKPWEAQLTLLSVGSMSEVSVLRQSFSQTCNMWRVRIEPTTSGFETYVVKNSGNYQPCVEHGSICAVGVRAKSLPGLTTRAASARVRLRHIFHNTSILLCLGGGRSWRRTQEGGVPDGS